MDPAAEPKYLASRKDFLTLDSTLGNRKQEIKFGNERGNQIRCSSCAFVTLFDPLHCSTSLLPPPSMSRL